MSIPINSISVKVMRSHDYCHFEVCLSHQFHEHNQYGGGFSSAEIDELRKKAARLADKAVEQYQIAKANAELLVQDGRTLERLQDDAREIEQKPEAERTPQEKAKLKVIQDLRFERRRYDYEDEWEDEEAWEPAIPETDDAIF